MTHDDLAGAATATTARLGDQPDDGTDTTATTARARPRVAVWKFASCDGCQLSLVSAEDELLTLAGEIDIAYFLEVTRAVSDGPYDVSIVEGSITTPGDEERIRHVREISDVLVTIGACATAGGIQALRNHADMDGFRQTVYAGPTYVQTLATSTAIAQHVDVDLELRGCPVETDQLVEAISALLAGRKPVLPTHSVCIDCKLRDTVCIAVADGAACLGPVTMAGCGARCPQFGRPCYGCFGPMEGPNTSALADHLTAAGATAPELVRLFRTFNTDAPAFDREARRHLPLAGQPFVGAVVAGPMEPPERPGSAGPARAAGTSDPEVPRQEPS